MKETKDREEGFSLRDLFIMGLGLMALAEEEAKKGVDVLLKKGGEKESQGKKYISELKEREKVREWEKRFERSLAMVAERLNLPTKSDIANLEKKIEELNKRVQQLTKEAK